jgi:hypothetical protein
VVTKVVAFNRRRGHAATKAVDKQEAREQRAREQRAHLNQGDAIDCVAVCTETV